jgi:hypothetical protein
MIDLAKYILSGDPSRLPDSITVPLLNGLHSFNSNVSRSFHRVKNALSLQVGKSGGKTFLYLDGPNANLL